MQGALKSSKILFLNVKLILFPNFEFGLILFFFLRDLIRCFPY